LLVYVLSRHIACLDSVLLDRNGQSPHLSTRFVKAFRRKANGDLSRPSLLVAAGYLGIHNEARKTCSEVVQLLSCVRRVGGNDFECAGTDDLPVYVARIR